MDSNQNEYPKVLVSNESAFRLIQEMVKDGFFHPSSSKQDDNYPDNDSEDMKQFIQKISTEFSTDSSNLILPLDCKQSGGDQSYVMTRDYLSSQILQRLNDRHQGRASAQEISSEMRVSLQDVNRSILELSDMENSCILRVGAEVLTEKYLHNKCRELQDSIQDRRLIHKVANDWNLPIQFTLEAISSFMAKDGFFQEMKMTVDSDGAQQLLTNKYEKKMLGRVEKVLEVIKIPTKMCDLMDDIPLPPQQVLNHVKSLCLEKALKGSLHVDEPNSSTFFAVLDAVYTPNCYEEDQEKEILEFFNTNLYVSVCHGDNVGMSKKRLNEYILKHNPQAIALNKCIIHPDVVMKVQSVIEESIEDQSFVALSMYLPEGITVADTETLIQDHVFCSMDKSARRGCLIVTSMECGESVYFSNAMIENISESCLQTLIEEFAKVRAVEIVNSLDTEGEELEDDFQTTGKKASKMKRKSKSDRKKPKRKTSSESETKSYGIVDLMSVAKAIAEKYPGLSVMEMNHSIHEMEKEPSWDDTEHYGGPLYAFCRNVFGDSVCFEQNCAKAVKAELATIIAARKGSYSTLKNGGLGAAKTQNIELSFEESFKLASQWLQVLAKFPESLADYGVDDNIISNAKKDFLNGFAANFTRRLTEYCIFKHGVDNVTFHFQPDGEDADSSDIFFTPVDTTQRAFQRVFLSCQSSEGSVNPLQMLRENLPGSSGVELARMWKFCGGENYESGEVGTSSFDKPGAFDKFLSHAEESCLSICGIPFKKLDKKSEKQLMFARKKKLSSQLQQSECGRDIFELSVVLLFQKLHNLAITGEKAILTAVNILLSDKKLPEGVTELLKEAVISLADDSVLADLPTESLEVLKLCGLSKDISKAM